MTSSSTGSLRLVLASANPDKAAEITGLLADVAGVELLERPASVPDVEETGETLVDNARLKAEALVEATGYAAVADDTGLAVEALDGAPGVYSARFAGEGATYADNVTKLLVSLEAAGANSPSQRRACFRTVALVSFPGGGELVAVGEVWGTIAPAARGTSGFGYDPLFIPDDGDGRTFAEMTVSEKHQHSHRGRAFRQLAQLLIEQSNGASGRADRPDK